MLEQINTSGNLLALIIRDSYDNDGLSFLTDEKDILQVGYMNYPPKKIIQPHIHNKYERCIEGTQEVIFIKEGRVRVNFYDDDREYVMSRELHPGDFVVLISGGHGFEILEATKMVEIKNGPYAGDEDKIRF